MPRDVGAYLTAEQAKAVGPECAEFWSKFEDYYNKKLWHQLTLLICDFITRDDMLKEKDARLKLYENFIAEFESRINPFSLVTIISRIVADMTGNNKQAEEFLLKTQTKVKASTEAVIMCKTLIGNIKLDKQQNLEETKKLIEDIEQLLESIDGVSLVHAKFYELSSNYYRRVGKHAEYYKEALRYLGCIELSIIPVTEQQEIAFYLGLAALLGEGVYNFGELLAHPILEALKSSQKTWLVDLLYIFNSGNLQGYEELRAVWSSQPDLAANELSLRQKISLLCLMEMTFKRQANNRQLTFAEIAKEARLPEDEVELLVMKALSLSLVRGHIDQVNRKVHMTWVQPRVLDRQQIATMQQRLDQWCKDVQSMELLLEDKAQDILT
uniref:26S proteasome non-ATPase regulatory subunit 13 n=1 Tax=Strigamia maritima TaxID=126957 RepID=T1JHP1_STRMM